MSSRTGSWAVLGRLAFQYNRYCERKVRLYARSMLPDDDISDMVRLTGDEIGTDGVDVTFRFSICLCNIERKSRSVGICSVRSN